MSSKIPKEIREKVLFQWMDGISLDGIASNVGIGAGSVSAIIKLYRENDSDFDQEREFVVCVKKHGLSIDQLALATRFYKLLERLHISPEQLESSRDDIEEHCYKRGMEIEEFIKIEEDVCNLSSKLGVPGEKLSSYLEDMRKEVFLLSTEIISKNAERENALHNLNMTEMQLKELSKSKLLIKRLQTTEGALAIAARQLNYVYMENHRLRGMLYVKDYECKVLAANTNDGFVI